MPALVRIVFTFASCEQSKLTPYAQPRCVLDEFIFITDEAIASALKAFCAFMASVVEPMEAEQVFPEKEREKSVISTSAFIADGRIYIPSAILELRKLIFKTNFSH